MKIQRISFLRFTDLIAAGAVTGRRVLIRADLNVPLAANGQITDDTRIRASRAAGAAVMVASHLGRPAEGQLKAADSLAPIAQRLSELLGVKVPLIQRWIDQGVEVSPGQVVLLENCRVNIGEKADSGALAQHMAALCDLYVNDAFGAAHRAEASTHGVAKYARIACAGPLMAGELDALARALNKPRRPLAAIVGRSKISTKLKVLTALAEKVDQLIVGGGIANTFMRAAGWPVGRSLAEPALAPEARAIMASMRARGAAVPIPVDVMTAKACSADANAQVKNADTVESDDFILDIGPRSAQRIAALLSDAGTIVWNGPLGVFELEPFGAGTKKLAEAIAASSAFSIAGGGDTLAAIEKYGVAEQIGYISTGGGAFLEFLEGRALPAVEILNKCNIVQEQRI